MKKLLLLFTFSLCFLSSCNQKSKENINIYVEKNLSILINEIVKIYENKNKDVKINISFEKPKSLGHLDIILTSENSIFSVEKDENKNENNKKNDETQENDINKFESSFFTDDNLIIIGRKKINDLKELLYTNIAVPNYDNTVGRLFIDNFSNSDLFKEISKKFEYTNDSISAMQSVDLYEVDFAIINSLLLNSVKNSEVCYVFTKTDENGNITEEKINYNIYIKKESSIETQDFYNFLISEKVKKIIDKNKNKS